ncbi:MAG TPA: hypothetical protein VIQ54_02820 [Polyangia bacterium]
MHATLIPILMSVALPGPPADRDEAVAVVQIDRILNAKQWIPCGRAFSIGLVDVSVVRVESGALPAAQIIVAIPCPVDGGYRAGFRFRTRLAARRPPAWTMRVADLHQEIPDDRVVRYARSAEPVCDGGLVDLAAVLQAGAYRLPRSSRSPDAAAADALAIGIEPERAAANLGRGFPLVVSLRNSTARPLPLVLHVFRKGPAFKVEARAEATDLTGLLRCAGPWARVSFAADNGRTGAPEAALSIELAPGGRLVTHLACRVDRIGDRPMSKGDYRLRVHTPLPDRAAGGTRFADGWLTVH